ncbi:MAG: hypothetical protein ACLT46_15130, partial [Hungatella sp.]
KEEWDERAESIVIKVAPLGVQIFSCTPVEEKKAPEKKAISAEKRSKKNKKAAESKTTEKNEQKRLQP